MTILELDIILKDLLYDAKSNSWKTGRIAPREDGLHGEMQMSDDGMDTKVAARLMLEGFAQLQDLLKDFRTTDTSQDNTFNTPQDIIDALEFDDYWGIRLQNVPDRNNATADEINVMGHDYVLAYMMAGWYKLVDPARQASWEAKRQDAALRLVSALRYKQKLD